MIPNNDNFSLDIEIEQQPSNTYQMRTESLRIAGFTDGLNAVKQAIYKLLNTERYESIIYSWNYGVELSDLIGEQPAYAYPEIKRRITEALGQDDRISGVDGFTFKSVKGAVKVQFTVHTTEGDIESEKVVAT